MNVGYGSGWTAALDLQFERAKERSIVSRCRHNGPLRVQKPFYPEDGVCHVYLLHPPGGVVGGDELSVSVRAGKGSAALITTPGATRVYRSAGPLSTIKYRLNVEAGASLEWLPQDSILYGGSRLSQEMEVRLASGSRFCGWDITSMGRPASGDHYTTGEFDQGFRLYVDSLPVLMERQRWRAGDKVLEASWGLSGHTVLGTFYGFPADDDILSLLRLRLEDISAGAMAVTLVDEVLVVRALADDAVLLRQIFADIWLRVREMINGFTPGSPRVWAT
ncbi:MAG: urease accessory protein UreD [Gammaproteobacteria bacterium]|nr:urease accessory protein UreD [Gammaproteobacteria bacterium]